MGLKLPLYLLIKACLLCLLAISFSFTTRGQGLSAGLANISQEKPFPCPINIFEKDGTGLMWVGTACGLRIFDGYEYLKTGNETDSLLITTLVADTASHLMWAGTAKGLFLIDYLTRRTIRKYEQQKSVQAILKSKTADKVFAAFLDGTLITIKGKQKVYSIKVPELVNSASLPHSGNMFIERGNELLFYSIENSDSSLWKLFLLHPESGRVTEKIFSRALNANYLNSYHNTIIVGTWGSGVKFFDYNTFREITPDWLDTINKTYGFNILQTCFLAGDLLYVYFNNACTWQINMKTGQHFKILNNVYITQEPQIGNPIFADEYQNIWLGQKTGLLRIRNNHNWFEQLLTHYPGLTSRPSTRGILEDTNGDLYIGSYKGLFWYSRQKDTWNLLDRKKKDGSDISVYQGQLLNDTAGDYLYFTSESEIFYRFHKKKKIFENDFYKPDPQFEGQRSFTLFKDNTGITWLGTTKGLAVYNPDTHEIIFKKEREFDLSNYLIPFITPTPDRQAFWAGTLGGGLYKVDTRKGILNRFYTGSKPALSNDIVYCATQDARGNVWVGTDKGLNVIDKDFKHIRYFNTENSNLCNSTIFSMLWQNDSIVWLGTQKGLSKYNCLTGKFMNYYVEDGICNNEFNRISTYKDSKGKMYFGGIAGVTVFYPESVPEISSTINLFVSRISVWDTRSNKERIIEKTSDNDQKLILQPEDRSLTLNMGISDYTDPDKNSYSYRIRELNREWISLGPQHVLKLESLPTGELTLELKATSSRGITSQVIRYKLIVTPPFYQTWWFYAIIIVVINAIIYLVVFIRFRNLKAMEQQRVKIASDLHDEIGGLVTRITVYSSSLKEGYLSPPEQSTRLDKIIDISQSLSTSIRDVLWTIDARNDNTSNLADRMMEHAQTQIRYTDIILTFNADDVDRNVKLTAFARQQLYRIFKEAINNVLKHSKATYIRIIYSHHHKDFRLYIENDGVQEVQGPKKVSSGQGNRNMAMRADSIGATASTKVSGNVYVLEVSSDKKIRKG